MMTGDGDVPAELSKLEKGFELLGELSRDEMLTIYIARDRLSGNEVAIKVLRARDARGREALAHYASDARLLTALEHPNIVAVHSVKWLTEDVVAVVTERVRGPSLRQVLDVAGTLPVARATEVLRGLGRALAWAHSSQIMHRDVRPETVLFEDRTGRVVLSDFGLARRLEAAPGAREPGADAYRAPELSDGRYPDRRSDVYSLGIVGWELLTGRRPWPDTMEPIEPGRRAPAPPPLAEVRPGLPPALVAALEGAVQLDRDRRIADVTTFMERLTKVAPPAPEPEEEQAEETPAAFAPAQWIALPVPPMPQRPATAGREREVPRETAREVGDAARVAESSSAAAAATTTEGTTEATTDARVERAVEQEVVRDAHPELSEPVGSPPARASQPTAASAEAVTSPLLPASTALPSQDSVEAKRRRPTKGGVFRDAPPAPTVEPTTTPGQGVEQTSTTESAPRRDHASRTEAASTPGGVAAESAQTSAARPTPPADRATPSVVAGTVPPLSPLRPESPARESASTAQGRPDQSRFEQSRAEQRRAEPPSPEQRGLERPRAQPTQAEQAQPMSIPADALVTGAAALGSAAAAATGPGAAHAEPAVSDAPSGAPGPAKPSTHIPSDVELPPPEPVRFADVPPQPLRGPISGPVRGQTRGAARVDSMRGGLGTPRPPKERSRGREASSGPPAPPPLQPMWDTPAEFPLPVMPDPRPMPADVAIGGYGATRWRWTRRGIGIAVAAVLLVIAAVTLARMERAPDTSAELIQPENPTGYGGDVVLPPRTADTTALTAPAPGRPGGPATSPGGARRPGNVAPPAARQPTTTPPTARRSPAASQPVPRARSETAAARGATSPTPPPTSAPAERATSSAAAPTRTAERRPATPAVSSARTPEPVAGSAPCNSPALADQRACLAAAIERSDAGLNQIYGDVIAAMRQRASTAPADPDPPEVQRLRAVQRNWLLRRDAECRRRGRGREGPLWAVPRAQCLEEFSADRSQQLSATLARLRRE